MNEETRQKILQKIALFERELAALKQLVCEDTIQEETQTATKQEQIPVRLPPQDKTDFAAENILAHLFTTLKENQNTDDLQAKLSTLLHSSISQHPPARDSFFRFSFKTFRGRWQEYLNDSQDPTSFTITRKRENQIGELAEIRIYLQNNKRSPSPITLKQDPIYNREWRIQAISL